MGKELDADAPATTASVDELRRDLASEDWKTRLIAMKQLGADGVPPDALLTALSDARMAIRRMAVIYLGMVKDKSFDPVPALCKALSDEAVAVRRTAGDALTDLGDARAMGPLTRCLQDSNKLVRWRAARFLYEHGNAGALEALEDASGDGEYEVSMQIRQAIERIEGGHAAQGTVWQQMTENPDT
jgi:HEAT repeat protein